MEEQKTIINEILDLKQRATLICEKYCEQGLMQTQLMIVIEEMSELTKEIIKYMRYTNNIDNILEEVADVCIMLMQVAYMFNITNDELTTKINEKLTRQEARMNKNIQK